MCGDSPPSRKPGEKITADIGRGIASGCEVSPEVGQTVTSRDGKGVSCGRDGVVGNPVVLEIRAGEPLTVYENHPMDSRIKEVDVSPTCTSLWAKGPTSTPLVEVPTVYENHPNDSRIKEVDVSPTCSARWGTGGGNVPLVQGTIVKPAMAVRRLTPTECERLQGFPDGYTQIPWRKKEAENCPDGPRYKALGNSMAVPVMRWIGERIAIVDKL